LKKAKGSQKVQQEVVKSPYDSIEGRDQLQKVLREKKTKADSLCNTLKEK